MAMRPEVRERLYGALISLVIGVILLSSAPFWYHPLLRVVGLQPEIAAMDGGCPPGYTIYAQGRWDPLGAAVRAGPSASFKQVGSLGANQPVNVDGWAHGATLYPNNPEPFNNDLWFHLSDGSGWVSFAGVRAQPVPRDASNSSRDGGLPAPTTDSCAASVA